MGIEGISNVSRVNSFLGPSAASSTVGANQSQNINEPAEGQDNGKTFFNLLVQRASDDGSLDTYLLKTSGNIRTDIDTVNLTAGKLCDAINNSTHYNLISSNDSKSMCNIHNIEFIA